MSEKTSVSYKDLLDSVSKYNSRLLQERSTRIPYQDSSNITHHDGRRIYSSAERGPGLLTGQAFTYPSRRWKLKPRPPAPPQPDLPSLPLSVTPSTSYQDSAGPSNLANAHVTLPPYTNGISSQVMAGAPQVDLGMTTSAALRMFEDSFQSSRDSSSWIPNETIADIVPRFDEPDTNDGGFSEDEPEEPPVKKKKGPPKGSTAKPGKARKDIDYTVIVGSEKPYSCNYCDMTYKTRPGLTYHVTKEHPYGKHGKSPPGATQPAASQQTTGHSSTTHHSHPQQQQQQQPQYQHQQPLQQQQYLPHGGHHQAAAPPVQFHHPQFHYPSQQSQQYQPIPPHQQQQQQQYQPLPPHQQQQQQYPMHQQAPPVPNAQYGQNNNQKGGNFVNMNHQMPDRAPQRDGRLLICDFCEVEHPTAKPAPKGEKLLTCHGCGHSAHPTCLNFSKNQRESTRQYPWKCIECKCCSFCNSAENDEKLLFCDDCDRGYHMYCLNPPLETTPEGAWSCDQCLQQYGEEAAFRVWTRKIQQEAVAKYQKELEESSKRASGSNTNNRQRYSGQ